MPKVRRPRADEELDIDELANSPALYGIEEAYQRFTTGPQLVEKPSATGTASLPESGSPRPDIKATAPDLDAPDFNAPNSTAPEIHAPISGAPIFTALEGATSVIVLSDLYAIYPRREYRPIPANSVQDGHTHGQQSVYSTIRRLGKPCGENARAIAIGERTLAAEVPMSYSSLQDNVRALLEKHSIEVHSRGPNKSKLYIALSYEEILRRRRALGLTHVIRRTSGVVLCTSSGAPTITAPSDTAPLDTIGAPNSGAVTQSLGAPSLPRSGAPSLGASLIRNKEITSEITTTTLSLVTSAIRRYLEIDDEGVRRIVEACRQLAPDATDEEIAHFADICAARIVSAQGISNPVGLLIKQTPKFFEGVALSQYRKQEEQRKEDKRQQVEAAEQQTRAMAESILNDPDSAPGEREWAFSFLRGAEPSSTSG